MKSFLKNHLIIALVLLAFQAFGQLDPLGTTASKCPTPLNLVTNGNFLYGNDGSFQSALPLKCNSCTAGSYCVGNQFKSKCSSWAANTFDHTLGSLSGNYLLVDGNPSSASNVWSDSICVCQGVAYTFSFWVKSIYPVPQQNFDLGLIIDGTNQKTVNIAQQTPAWTKYEVNWTSNKTGCIPIAIRQLTGGAYRDFGIDDIFFGYCCDCVVLGEEDECLLDIDTTIVKVLCGNVVDINMVFDGTPSYIKCTIYDSLGNIIFIALNSPQFTLTLPGAGVFYGIVEASCGGGDDKGGDEDMDVFEIINSAPVANFRMNSTYSCIQGRPTRNITTEDYSNEEGQLTYTYVVTDVSTNTSTTFTTAEPAFQLDSKKAYTINLTVTDTKGCTAQKTLNLKAATACKPKFDWWYSWCDQNCTGTQNVTLNFVNQSEYSICSYQPVYKWEYGDGQSATGYDPQHVYNGVPCAGKSFSVKLTMTLGNPGDADYCKSVWDTIITLDRKVPKVIVDRVCCDGLVFFSTDATKGKWSTPGSLNIPKWPAVSKKIWKPFGIQIGQNYRQYYSNAGVYTVTVDGAETESHNRCPVQRVEFSLPVVECFNRNVKIKKTDTKEGITIKYKFTALALPGVHQMKSKIRTSKKVSEISTNFSGSINGKANGCYCAPFNVGNSTGSGTKYNKRKAKYLASTSGKYRIGMNKATANFYIKTTAGNPYSWQLNLGKTPCDHPWFMFF